MHERLKDCRLKHGFSQKYVAMTIGVSKPTISQWESGAKRPAIENLISLASLYQTTVDYLIGNTDEDRSVQANALTVQERQLLSVYRALTSQGREYVRQQLDIARRLYSGDDHLSDVENG